MRFLLVIACLLTFTAPARGQKPGISFRKDIVPILANSCVKCHSGNKPKGGLDLTTHKGLLMGGDSGQVLLPGKPDESLLIQLVSGQDEDRIMPAQGPRLTSQQVTALTAWIESGAAWEPGIVIQGLRQAELAPRRPAIPAATRLTQNPVDLFLLAADPTLAFDRQVPDHLFARRVYLDILGLLPPAEELRTFVSNRSGDKRELLVIELLSRNKEYTEHWLTLWNDILRNAYIGTGYIDGGRTPITDWLYQALYNNMPYDRFVHELLDPSPQSGGFIRGIIWRGVVNASQQREMQAAQNISQVFLGTNLKCASCHDSFVNHWKLKDAYGLAAIFAEGELAIHNCNKPTGETAAVQFIYPELGEIDGSLPRAQRLRQLADIMVKPENGRLTRTIVNRLWAQLMGRGIVEPVDDMDQLPFNQDLLDWLAVDLADHDYDLKHTIKQIVTSHAYQLPSVGAAAPDETDFVFAGPIVRRMSAEQFVDAVNSLTRTWPVTPAIKLPPVSRPSAEGQHAIALKTSWIWDKATAKQTDTGGTVYFRKHIVLQEGFERVLVAASCDNGFILYVNGHKVVQSDEWNRPQAADLTALVKPGDNLIAIHGYNFPDPVTRKGLNVKGANAAGLIANLAIGYRTETDGQLRWESIGTDSSWSWSRETVEKWQLPTFDDSGWTAAAIIGTPADGPWKIAQPLLSAIIRTAEGKTTLGLTRTSLVNDDQLTRTLGRPNREQVLTRRSSIATTLQAIELTNGTTLDTALKAGAAYWQGRGIESTEQLIRQIYTEALCRPPGKQELEVASRLFVGSDQQQAIEDLLWIITMLPEFQLVY